jgi:hypothetical protein
MIMEWPEIRQHYPEQWLLLEALKAHSQDEQRILEQLAVLGAFPDSVAAWKSYQQTHREAPARELYIFHTSREKLDVRERQWVGIRRGA